ncbi:MAG: hypothetical protein R8L07_15445 [Alphaproteobacteria bacterium]|nr:hypothetical protein [Alphaproteobacteria bacterium]
MSLKLGAWWGDDDVYVELLLSQKELNHLLATGELTKQGNGYSYEGEEFQDVWRFTGGLNGLVRISYASVSDSGDEGDGYIGKPCDLIIEEE